MNKQTPMSEKTNQTLVTQCHEALRDLILNGDLAPGKKLKVTELTTLLNVGPTPVREALSRLANTGLVVATDNKGFRVKDVSEEEVRDLYYTFTEIERIALQRSIKFGTSIWEGEVIAALHRLTLLEKKRSVDFLPWLKENDNFHSTLVSACGSPMLLELRNHIYQLLSRYTRLSFINNNRKLSQNNKDHQIIAKAALARKDDLACQLLESHLSGSVDHIVKRLKEEKLI